MDFTRQKYLLVTLVSCMISVTIFLSSCNNDDNDVATYQELKIEDARITKSYHDDKNGTTIFNIEYPSQDPYGNPVTLSGIFAIGDEVTTKHLKGTLLYNRFTINREDQCPSRGNITVVSKLSGINLVTIAADGYGFGSTNDKNQPYCISRANAQASVDALIAVHDILKKNGYTLDDYLFNMGYSQGGQTAIGVVRLCAEKYPDIKITHTIAGGGPYDMAETYRRLVELNTTTMPSTVISSLVAFNEFYNIGAEYSDLFLEPTCDRIEPYLLSKKYSIDVLNKNLTNSQTISDWFTPAMCDFNSDLSKKFIVALEDDNLTKGWTPHGDERIILVQSTVDDSVPVENTEKLADFLKDNGLNIITSNSNAKYNPGTVFVYKKDFGDSFGGPHYAAAISFVEEFISAMRHYLNVKGIWFTLENLDELY